MLPPIKQPTIHFGFGKRPNDPFNLQNAPKSVQRAAAKARNGNIHETIVNDWRKGVAKDLRKANQKAARSGSSSGEIGYGGHKKGSNAEYYAKERDRAAEKAARRQAQSEYDQRMRAGQPQKQGWFSRMVSGPREAEIYQHPDGIEVRQGRRTSWWSNAGSDSVVHADGNTFDRPPGLPYAQWRQLRNANGLPDDQVSNKVRSLRNHYRQHG